MAKVRKMSKESLLRSVCRESFKMFVKEFWECIPGSSDLIWNWHMDVLCEELQIVAERVFAGEKKQYDLVINISPGSSKPVWEEMPVLMADGTYKPLREVRVGDRVIGKTGKGCVVTAVHEQGLQSCVKILTASKREIVAATDHPIMTTMGWTKAGMVTIGDHLGLMHSPQIEGSTTRSIDEFSLAGYFIGDGSVTHGNCALTSKDPEYIEDFCAVSQRLGFIPNVRVARNGVTIISLKSKKRESQRGRFKGKGRGFNGRKTEGPRGWLREIGMMGKSSRTKEIPDFVWKGSNEQVAAFLAAYFHCDGCVSYKHEGKKNISVSFCSVSRNLALGIQRLLLRLGICMRLDKHVAKNGFVYNRGLKNYSYYTVNTTDQDSASRFLELIPLLGRKKDKLKDFEPERRTFQQRFWPDRVVSVEQAGMLPCRCLTVEGDRSFVVEGVVVHNSSLCSILFQPWTWTRMPCARHITASHTDTLALDLANKSRAVVNSDKYQACFPEIQIRSDQDSKGYFINTSGGDRITATVGGKSPIGFHGHFITVDDPLDPKKALSEVELKLASSFMTDTLPSRKVDKAVSVTITIMQRLHDDDPSGHLIKRHEKGLGTIRHLCLPARLTDYVNPPELKDRYIDGLMDPKRLGEEILRDMENALGAYSFAGQFLQSPIPLSGGMFRDEYFNQRVKAAPYHAKRIRYWDRASQVADVAGCYTAGVLIAKDDRGDYYIEHCVHGQWEPTERNEKMRATALRDRARYGPSDEPVIWVEAEGGSSGRDAWKGVARALAGFHVREDRVTGKKEFRAEPWSAQLAAKNVYIVDNGESQGTGRSDWDIESYVKEHCLFPMAKLKDQVDASTGAFNLLAGVRSSGTLKIMQYRVADRKSKNDNKVRIWICSKKELDLLYLQDKYLLISLENKTEVTPVTPAIVVKKQNELDTETIQFMDVSPEERQDRWDEPVEPYGKLPHEIIATKDDGKKFWRFLLKKRQDNPKALVIQDDGDDDRRAVSVAAAVCDCFRLSREKTIYRLTDDSKVIAEKEEPPNRHVYNIIRTTRNLIV